VSIKPDTDVEVLKKYEGKFSKILIMTVNPGFGGQVYIESINEKIKKAKRLFPNKVIQIDGGVNEDTITEGLNLGVKDFVLGNYLLLSPNKEELYNRVLKLNIIKDIWAHEKDRNVDFDKKLLQIVPNGYGQNDILVGVCVPSIRKLASKWYKHVNFDILDFFISSRYHEYRQFSIFCITNIMNEKLKKNDIDGITQIYRFFEKNINYINNWDLTDEIGPKVLGNYLKIIYKSSYLDARNEVNMYLNNKNMWVKRLGIVSMLTLAKDSITDLPLDVCKEFFYTSEPLLQKATGWVLREIYVKDQKTVIETLSKFNHEKSIPGIILSYACEKMSISEKEYIKKI
jgi:3-methyladenine DNA glycosylase AlkD